MALFTPNEMAAADRLAIAAGTPGRVLMARAGAALADAVRQRFAGVRRIAVVCGPGNNGGDGFVAARLLAATGCAVRLALLGDRAALKGDAADAATGWDGPVDPPTPAVLEGVDLVIDALFGAGLTRPLDGAAAALVEALNAARLPVVAVDVPSGLDGATGRVAGPVVQATLTVTFHALKPGHLLYPGRALCGETRVADIGIPADAATRLGIRTHANTPALWNAARPRPGATAHKYVRGHALVIAGPREGTGATRLAALAALRVGAGLVTVAAPTEALDAHLAGPAALMVRACDSAEALDALLADPRRNALLVGPAGGTGEAMRDKVSRLAATGRALVLDADALTGFAGDAPGLARLVVGKDSVITPHEGEFRRLFSNFGAKAESESNSPPKAPAFPLPGFPPFAAGYADALKNVTDFMAKAASPDSFLEAAGLGSARRPAATDTPAGVIAALESESKLEAARRASRLLGAVVVLKGPDTVIAAPDGRAAINANAPPTLATAGSGDVLAGLITGLRAQGMPGFEAAAAGVWMHGAAAALFGPGLIADDLPTLLPRVLAALDAET